MLRWYVEDIGSDPFWATWKNATMKEWVKDALGTGIDRAGLKFIIDNTLGIFITIVLYNILFSTNVKVLTEPRPIWYQ